MTAFAAAAASAPAIPVWLAAIVAVVAAIGGVGGIVALFNLPKTRQKMDAEAAEVLTGAAVAIVAPLKAQVDELRARVVRMERREREHLSLLHVHAAWDELAVACLREAGMEVPHPPPLHLRSEGDEHATQAAK